MVQPQTQGDVVWSGSVRGFKVGFILSSIYTVLLALMLAFLTRLDSTITNTAGVLYIIFIVMIVSIVLGILPSALLGTLTGGLVSTLVAKMRPASNLAAIGIGIGVALPALVGLICLLQVWKDTVVLALVAIPFVVYIITSGWMGLTVRKDLQTFSGAVL